MRDLRVPPNVIMSELGHLYITLLKKCYNEIRFIICIIITYPVMSLVSGSTEKNLHVQTVPMCSINLKRHRRHVVMAYYKATHVWWDELPVAVCWLMRPGPGIWSHHIIFPAVSICLSTHIFLGIPLYCDWLKSLYSMIIATLTSLCIDFTVFICERNMFYVALSVVRRCIFGT